MDNNLVIQLTEKAEISAFRDILNEATKKYPIVFSETLQEDKTIEFKVDCTDAEKKPMAYWYIGMLHGRFFYSDKLKKKKFSIKLFNKQPKESTNGDNAAS